MAFSFNPATTGQSVNQQGSALGATSGVAPLPGAVPLAAQTPLSSSTSPLLFLRGGEEAKSSWAYIQLFLLLATILSLIVSVVLFSYGMYLSSSVASKKEELATKENSFKEYSLDDALKLSNRMSYLNSLLKNYISVRSPLKFLEDVVEKQVYFSEFSLNHNLKGQYFITLVAVTGNYPSLIQQLDSLSLSQYASIVPKPNLDRFYEEKKDSSLRVRVTAPVFVQGLTSDDIVFIKPASTSTSVAMNQVATSSASSTPQ